MSEMSVSEQKKEDWMNSKWRPMMGWMYMLVCVMDFVIFPILWSIIQTLGGGRVETQWNPITLQGAGLFHMAMGAVLGVTAWSRGQEKLAGVNNNSVQTPSVPVASMPSTSYTQAPSWGTTPITTTSGKTVVPQTAQPEI
jgi:hypothetical protein